MLPGSSRSEISRRLREVPRPVRPALCPDLTAHSLEFIPIKPLAAMGSGGPGSYAGHSRFPLRHHGRPASTGGSLTTRQRLTLLLTCSIRSRREWSAWLALCCAGGSSAPGGFFVGMRISTWGRVKARKPRSCNSRLPAGRGYGVASASRLSWMRPPTVSLRNRMMSGALTSRMFFTVWSFFLPL